MFGELPVSSSFPISEVILSCPSKTFNKLVLELIAIDVASKYGSDGFIYSLKYYIHFGVHAISYKCILSYNNSLAADNKIGLPKLTFERTEGKRPKMEKQPSISRKRTKIIGVLGHGTASENH